MSLGDVISWPAGEFGLNVQQAANTILADMNAIAALKTFLAGFEIRSRGEPE